MPVNASRKANLNDGLSDRTRPLWISDMIVSHRDRFA
jgi:hypothetical protein